jgi:hypothetical protein
MSSAATELAGMNEALRHQEKVVKQLENCLFLEQLRLASLKAARDRALRRAMLGDTRTNAVGKTKG